MKRILFVLALLPLLLAPSCADDDLQPRRNETDLEALDRLVPITEIGAGTFGCLLNGELWIPEATFSEDAADAVAGTTNPNDLTISARKRPISDTRDHLLTIGSVFTIDIKTPLKTFSEWNDREGTGECSLLIVDTLQENFMLVTYFDQTNKVVSGEFEAVLINSDCPQDTIRVTEGRFDLPYRD